MARPSGDQVGDELGPIDPVSCLASPPSTGMIQTSVTLVKSASSVRLVTHARCRPSGDQAGSAWSESPLGSCCGEAAPLIETRQRCLYRPSQNPSPSCL